MTEAPAATLLAAAERAGGFSVFLGALERAGLNELLSGAVKHTLFAPTDEAFANFPSATLAKLKTPAQSETLKALISAHLATGQIMTERLKGCRIRGKSVEGSELVLNGMGVITVNGAAIVRPDIKAANGVLHGIDKVLWPIVAPRASKVAASG